MLAFTVEHIFCFYLIPNYLVLGYSLNTSLDLKQELYISFLID